MKRNRNVILAAGAATLLLAGIIYAWSFLKPPIAELYGWEQTSGKLQFNYTLTLIFYCVGGLLSGFSAKVLAPRIRLLASGLLVVCGLTIVSRLSGKSPLTLYLGYGAMTGTVPGFPVKVADTNGAGDTFFGAFLSRIAFRGGLDGLTGPEVSTFVRFANKAASITASRPGAIPAMPTLEEVEEGLR